MNVTRQALLLGIGSLAVFLTLPKDGAAQSRDSATVDTSRVTTLSAQVIAATRSVQTLRDVPASVALLDASAIRISPAKTVADFLKVVPGFAMRDFQSTLVAHPSRQAPVFRGLQGSSSSRVLVLLDGVPVNDPFAGWIHWSRVPMSLLSRVEIVRGGGSGVWGDRALSGVISLETAEPQKNTMELSVSGGTFGTRRTSGSASLRYDKLSVQLAGDLTKSDGYIAVPKNQRGAIDTPAGVDDRVAYGRVTYHFTPLISAFVSGNVLAEARPNATPLRVDSTAVQEARAGVQWLTAGGSRIQATVFGFKQDHENFFSTESLDRRTEIPSLNQFSVPARSVGGLLSWSRQVSRHQLTAGGDVQRIEGAVNEDLSYVVNQFTRRRKVDAEQRLAGVFLQDAIDFGRVRVLASVRQDAHRTENGHRIEMDLTNYRRLVDSTFASTKDNRTSYNLGARFTANRNVSLRGSVYSAFRSPTMNELYKPFRDAGNVLVEANATLGTERLFGVEGGVDVNLDRGAVRLTVFDNRLNDGIVDATIALAGTTGRNIAPCGFVPAGGTCKQRLPVNELRSRGLEAEAEFNPTAAWQLRAAYAFNPTEIIESQRMRELEGKEARGAAKNSYTLAAVYRNPRAIDAAATVRFVGARFDDDVNALPLTSFTVVDVRASREILQGVELFLGIENLLDEDYTVSVANSGLRRNGMPRSLEGGFRYRW